MSKVLYRLGYYLGGFSIGLILLAFFLKGSGSSIPSCDYMPNARVLKTIRTKGYTITPEASEKMKSLGVDTTDINRLLREGEVNFSKSEPRKEPCGEYFIELEEDVEQPISILLKNCKDQVAIIDCSL